MPLPMVNPEGVNPPMGDLFKAYLKDQKCTGRDSDFQNLSRFQQAYMSMSDSDGLKALLRAIDKQSPAGDFYYRYIRDKPDMATLTCAFEHLHAWYRSHFRVSDLTDEWHSLPFG